MRTTIWYRVPENCERSYYKVELEGKYNQTNCKRLAEEAGLDYWYNHNGWEDTWPLIISIHEIAEGPELGRYDVEMEGVPTFYAGEIRGNK